MKSFFNLGFSTRTLRDDVSAGVVKSIDSVTGGMANALLAGYLRFGGRAVGRPTAAWQRKK